MIVRSFTIDVAAINASGNNNPNEFEYASINSIARLEITGRERKKRKIIKEALDKSLFPIRF